MEEAVAVAEDAVEVVVPKLPGLYNLFLHAQFEIFDLRYPDFERCGLPL